MPLKVILNVDLETGESDNFLWSDKEEPPPLVRPKMKKRQNTNQPEVGSEPQKEKH